MTTRLFHSVQYKAVKDGIDTLSRNYSQYVHIFSAADHPNSDLGHLIVGVPRAHIIRHTRRVGLLRTNDQPVGKAATYTTYNKHQRLTSTPLYLILTRDPRNQEASGIHLRQQGHRNLSFIISYKFNFIQCQCNNFEVNPLTPNDPYRGRTAPLTSKSWILYIYSSNISTEYFKHGIYSPFFLFRMQFVS